MLGSHVIDVVIGVVSLFLGVSLATSALTEAIASLVKLRHKTLLAGVQALLNDRDMQGLAGQLYQHALINPLCSGKDTLVKPAYIQSRGFALALTDVLNNGDHTRAIADCIADVKDEQIRRTLQTLLAHAQGDLERFQAGLATWFDTSMDRVSGWYKRRTQVISFIVALVVAFLLNADALRATTLLWARPSLAAAVASGMQANNQQAAALLQKLDAESLIGWADWHLDEKQPVLSVALMLLGWTVAAGAALFGAPFWFDVLQRFTNVRGTGDAAARAPVPGKAGVSG